MLAQYTIMVAFIMMCSGLCGMFFRRHFLLVVYCGTITFLGIILLLACFFSPLDPNIQFIAAVLIVCSLGIFTLCANTYIFICYTCNTTVVAEFRKLRG